MSERLKDHRIRALEYVLDTLSEAERISFEKMLAENSELLELVNEYRKTLDRTQEAFTFNPSELQLQEQRLLLKGRIAQIESDQHRQLGVDWFSRLKSFLSSPQPAWAVISYILIAILVSRFFTWNFDSALEPVVDSSINIAELLKSEQLKNIKLTGEDSNLNGLHFIIETGKAIEINGKVNEPEIQQLLFYLLLNDENPGKRLNAVKLLQQSAQEKDAQSVLVSALLTDPNPGVRLKSINILQSSKPSELILDASIKVLLEDENEAVRHKALQIIAGNPHEKSLPVLQIVSVMDDNEYIRNQAVHVLNMIREKIAPDKIESKS